MSLSPPSHEDDPNQGAGSQSISARRRNQQSSVSRAWLSALAGGTAVIQRAQMQEEDDWDALSRDFDDSYDYLDRCAEKLKSLEQYWSQPPRQRPPKQPQQLRIDHDKNNNEVHQSSTTTILPMRRLLIRVLTAQSDVLTMKVLRCMLQNRNDSSPWLAGAELYERALHHIHAALHLADSAYAQCFLEEDEDDDDEAGDSVPPEQVYQQEQAEQVAYQEDAQIVAVAIESLVQGRDKLVQKAQQAAGKLRRKLEPQWTSRDQVRERWGNDRWEQNPRPKNDYARLRKEDERALRRLEQAIRQLETLVIPQNVGGFIMPTTAQQQQQVGMMDPYYYSNNNENHNNNNGRQQRRQAQRYNDRRPTDLSRRVPLQDYPDPADFGWIFTGSWNNYVEFFEKMFYQNGNGANADNGNHDNDNDDNDNNNDNDVSIVKLDWYFTKATIKTSLVHPRQKRKTQLFGNQVDPAIYRQILENPRVHTNERYHTTKNKDRNNNNNQNNNNGNNHRNGNRTRNNKSRQRNRDA